jgi:hypothetical protein
MSRCSRTTAELSACAPAAGRANSLHVRMTLPSRWEAISGWVLEMAWSVGFFAPPGAFATRAGDCHGSGAPSEELAVASESAR